MGGHYSRSAEASNKGINFTTAPQVSGVSLHLQRTGTSGLGKPVAILDTFGSRPTNSNAVSWFVSGAAIKRTEISILSFEVANTIVKGFNLLQSLSTKSIQHLKEEVLLSEAVQDLVSEDKEELLRFVAADKWQELEVFSNEVVRFGNHSPAPQWHNLDRYFENIKLNSVYVRNLSPALTVHALTVYARALSRDEAESIMQQLMTLVQFTAELHELLHRFEQDFQEVKSQKKQIKYLKKKSLWSRSLEEVIEKLVYIVQFLSLEISNAFGSADGHKHINRQRLGPAGLALHYANIVLQIDTLAASSSSMPENTRDTLYQNLPPNINLALRSKLPHFHVGEELTVADIKDEMDKTLHWLVPIATNTSKAHHSYGWVGEWAYTFSSEVNRKSLQAGAMRIETFHHADKDKVEYYILQLLLWLHRLAIKSKAD